MERSCGFSYPDRCGCQPRAVTTAETTTRLASPTTATPTTRPTTAIGTRPTPTTPPTTTNRCPTASECRCKDEAVVYWEKDDMGCPRCGCRPASTASTTSKRHASTTTSLPGAIVLLSHISSDYCLAVHSPAPRFFPLCGQLRRFSALSQRTPLQLQSRSCRSVDNG